MPEQFRTWIQRLAASRSLNQSQLAIELGLAASVVQRWWSGTSKPSAANAQKVADFFGVPRDEVYEIVGLPTERPVGIATVRPFDDVLLEAIARRPVAIPIHDQAASAGFGQAVMEYAYWEPPRVAGRNIVGLRVHGTSMEPDYMDGDTIFMDTDRAPEVGKTVVATLGDEVLVKKLRRRGGKLVLVGKNGEWDASKAKIEGVVISLSRDVE